MEELSSIDQVLDFLRNNGLSRSESALMDDILEKSHLGSFDFQRFLFPTAPPSLPSLKIPPPPSTAERPGDAGDSSDDEFVSLVSSFTDLCSPETVNPFRIKTSRAASSQASSDQFGSARDHHEPDSRAGPDWSDDSDPDPFGGPSQDKFVTNSEKEPRAASPPPVFEPLSDPLEKTSHPDRSWPLTSIGYVKDGVKVIDYYDLNGNCRVYDNEEDKSCDYDLVGGTKNTRESENQGGDNVNGDDEIQEFRLHDGAHVEKGDAHEERLMYADEDEYETFDLRIIHRKNRTGFEEHKDLPIVLNGLIGSRYCVTEYLGSAAFSRVVQAHDLGTGVEVCLKIIKNDKDFFDQSLDEIKLLKFVNKHDPGDERHILRLYDYFYFQEHLIIVCELLRANLYEFQKYNRESGGEPYFTPTRLQVITRQCLEALEYLHGLGIIHCDLKPENVLVKSYSRCEIKVIDLGSSCFRDDNLSLYVQSRSYRAPEVIIGLPYDEKIDIWSLGCIVAELASGEVLFPNDALVILLGRVIGMLGPIDTEMLERGQETDKYFTDDFDLYQINEETNQVEYIIPQETSLEEQLQAPEDALFVDFVRSLLETNPQRRPTARQALQHPWLYGSYLS